MANSAAITKIVAICLVRNEEYFIDRVIRNIYDFCDKIFLIDNISIDSTFNILKKIAQSAPKVELHSLKDISKSQEFIKDYAGTSTWVFGVDGDEIYDPNGLKLLRKKILEGGYKNCTQIYGNVLNCSFLDEERKIAQGYLAPPCRSMTKLYNFELIADWSDPGAERLHGDVTYKEGFSKNDSISLHEQCSWEESTFRCLHLCFLRRSGQDAKRNADQLFARANIADLNKGGLCTIVKRWVRAIFKINEQSSWKLEKYSRGALVIKDVSIFFYA